MLKSTAMTEAKLGGLQRALVHADDRQVLRTVQVVDALSDRGAADVLLGPVRERLKALRPPRPWRLSRLLFTPLNAVLISRDAWRPGTPRLPRVVISPIAALVRRESADSCIAAERIMDTAAAGALIWPQAAATLASATVPAEWSATHLPAAAFRPLAAAVAAGLVTACILSKSRAARADPDLVALLDAARAEGPVIWGVTLTIVLQYSPRSDAARSAMASHPDPVWNATARDAVASAWRWVDAGTSMTQAAHAADPADALQRRIELLNVLAEHPVWYRRGLAARARLRAASAQQLEIGLRDALIMPLRALTTLPDRGAPQIDPLAAVISELQRLDAVARQLDDTARLDAAWRDAISALQNCAALPPGSRQRLIDGLGSQLR